MTEILETHAAPAIRNNLPSDRLSEAISQRLISVFSHKGSSVHEVERLLAHAARVRAIYVSCIRSALPSESLESLAEKSKTLSVPYLSELVELEISREEYVWMRNEVRRYKRLAEQCQAQ